MARRKHILIVRLSALGDVAILQPLLRQKMSSAGDVTVTVAAPRMLGPLFTGIPGVEFIDADKSLGNWGMFRKMVACRPTVVADLHGVNRTFILDLLFLVLRFIPVHVIHKQYRTRKAYLRREKARLLPSWKLYDDVLCRAGLGGEVSVPEPVRPKPSADGRYRVGIAPFSTFPGKNWSIEEVGRLVGKLVEDSSVEVFLFGGKKYAGFFSRWEKEYPGCRAVYGIPFAEELELIGSLNVMVSMDSANMHFASCAGVPVVSVWGASHPDCGFYGWGQNPDWAVGADMDCRPCSIFGNRPCSRGDYRCMSSVRMEQVYEKVRCLLV